MPRRNLGPCSIVAIDPGTTTGLLVVSVDPRWLKGQGPATWEGLGAAVRFRTAYQVGRHPRASDADRQPKQSQELDELLMPIMAREQPLMDEVSEFDGRGRNAEAFYGIMRGDSSLTVSRADLSMVDASEVLQVRQIAGLLDNFSEAAIVIEDFQLRTQNKDREAISPARLRLAIQTEEILHGAGRIAFLQQPSEALSSATDERVKRAGLYFRGMVHATDAARHAATFFRRARAKEELRSQAWPRHFQQDWED